MTRRDRHYPMIGIGVIVLRPDAVLLVRRAKPPDKGRWTPPGGAQELGETAEQAARRELAEETGLAVGPLTFIDYVDSIHRDAAGAITYHYTILDFAALWCGGNAAPASDVTEIAWARYDAFPSFALSQEAERIISLARARLMPDTSPRGPR